MLNSFRSEKGAVMVIAALMMVTLLSIAAIALDVGHLYVVKAKLQSAADAAALAGATTLMDSHDVAIADSQGAVYVAHNLSGTYQYSSQSIIPTSTFTVSLSQDVNFYFAPIMGIKSSSVRATATASANTIIALSNVVPFAVVQQQFKYGQQYILKYAAGGGQGGNYGPVALGGNVASTYRDNIMYGYQGQIRIDDVLTTKPGNMAGPTDQGVSYRKSLCTNGCSYQTQIEANCPRVVIAPVIDSLEGNGRTTVTVVGFAAFFLEDTQVSTSKGQKDIVGRFLKWSAIGETGNAANSFGLIHATLNK